MRWLVIPGVAAAFIVADPTPANAQVIVGNPTYAAPLPRPAAPFPGLWPNTSGVIPFVNGGPVEYALNTALRQLAWGGYGPYAGYFAPYGTPGYFANPYGGYYDPRGVYRPYNVPAKTWKWADPWPGNNGWHKGWYKGGGKGAGKGGARGGGKGGGKGKGR